jgi:Protein of unknown function (DUF3106)
LLFHAFKTTRSNQAAASTFSLVMLFLFLLTTGHGAVWGQPHPALTQKSESKAPEQSPRWRDLKAATQQALMPLQEVWPSISRDQKLKWMEVAQRMPHMTADERARVQLRMSEWVMLGPVERGQTRLNFQQVKQLPPGQRQTQWQTYLALPEEEKRQLADSRAPQGAASKGQTATKGALTTAPLSRSAKALAAGPKSKITPNPAFSAPPTPVAPTLVHPSYGATTTLLTKPATPPAHQQVGLPKILSSSRFIDPKTLLPRRGPQAAVSYHSTLSDAPLERP